MPFADRPWGHWQVLEEGNGYKVKKIVVLPGGRLSLQTHEHRSEFWYVLKGMGGAIVGHQLLNLEAGSTVRVNFNQRHRLWNTSEHMSLHVLEIQRGTYLGEDDIIRIEDDYSR